MQKIYLLGLFFLGFQTVWAQQSLYHFPVPYYNAQGDSLVNALAGGQNNPQYSPIDFDGDGKKDLMVFDRAGQIAQVYQNLGDSGEVKYRLRRDWQNRLPQRTINFMLARDYNCDGTEDIFYFNQTLTGASGIGVIKGHRDTDGQWFGTPEVEILRYRHPSFPQFGLNDFFIFNPDLPAFGDVDGDGDMDILTFTLDFTYAGNLQYYRNYSAERGHGCDSLLFEIEHECWGMFSENGDENNTYSLSPRIDSCANNPWWSPRNARHLGSTVSMVDFDGNGTTDVVISDVSIPYLNLMRTQLINDTSLVTSQDTLFPSNNVQARVFSFPAAFFLDLNNDGRTDMLVATNEALVGEALTDSTTWYYENRSNTAAFDLELRSRNFLGDGMMDFGSETYPCLVDLDDDGLLDLIIGRLGDCKDFFRYETGLVHLRNTGTATQPRFELQTRNYAGLDSLNLLGMYPAFGDLDGDGDLDLLLGSVDGSLTYVPNIGTAQSPAWGSPQRNYANISVFNNSKPQLVDIDRDGDLDLMIGGDSRLYYYNNKGTAQAPNFDFVSSTFGVDLISLDASGQAAPHFYDNNGNFELFLGHTKGGIIHLDSIENNVTGIYRLQALRLGGIYTGFHSALALGDLNGDDTLDMVIGNIRGGLDFYSFAQTDTTPLVSMLEPAPNPLQALRVFPNPSASGQVQFWATQPLGAALEVRVYNALGQLQVQNRFSGQEDLYSLDLSVLSPGLYFLECRSGQNRQVFKWQRL